MMGRSRKWIEGIKPGQPVTRVAKRALRERLRDVWHYAALASCNPEKDAEYVHQLRVSARRARAVLEIFANWLPRRNTRKMKKTLRRLRRSAGDARDLDVLYCRLTEIADAKRAHHLCSVIKQVATHRQKAQEPVIASYKKARRQRFRKRSRALIKRVRRRNDESFAEAARSALGPIVDDFFVAAASNTLNDKTLHRMRVSGKQVRYAMELTAGAFDASFREELYPTFVEVQEKLGEINDHVTAIATFTDWFDRSDDDESRTELSELIATEEKKLDQIREEFRVWWTVDRTTRLRRRFNEVLQIPATHSRDEIDCSIDRHNQPT